MNKPDVSLAHLGFPPLSPSMSASRQNSTASNHQENISADLLAAAAQAQASGEQELLSGESDDGEEGSPDGAQKGEKRKKRSRACQACRNMKIRCNPVEGQEACLACSKVNRQCVMPGPARKRQKTVHKVAELEKKINALTQSLLAKSQDGPTPQQSPVITDGSGSTKVASMNSPEDKEHFPLFPKPAVSTVATALPQIRSDDEPYKDVVDRGILSFAVADRIFEKFMKDLNPQFPLIAFRPGTNAESIRRSQPMLFLSILAAGCIQVIPEVHNELAEELASQFAHRIYFIFERSVELVQALLVSTTWIGKHQKGKDIGFNQYIHSAIVMAHDLGMSKRLKQPLTTDPWEEADLRRTWLGCYWCGMCVSTTLRHPTMINFSPYIQECFNFFEKSPVSQAGDRTLCALVKAVRIMEDVSRQFHMTDPASVVRIEDTSTQYALKVFEQRIDDWSADSVQHLEPGLHGIISATLSIYAHEIALHTDHNIDDFRPPSGRPGAVDDQKMLKDFVTPLHLEGITKCVVAMKQALEGFIGLFPSPAVAQLPCLAVVWTAYCVVAMIRLDGALRATKSKYADIFLPDLKVEYYLDSIIDRLNSISSPKAPLAPAAMFVQAFQKLKVWHQFRQAGALPQEYEQAADVEKGTHQISYNLDKFSDEVEKFKRSQKSQYSANRTDTMNIVHDGSFGANAGQNPAQDNAMRIKEFKQQQAAQQQNYMVNMMNPQNGFDTQGGSWLTNSSMPIDASMFENQDWNFTLADWNNFEASMVQPAGGTWLGYLL